MSLGDFDASLLRSLFTGKEVMKAGKEKIRSCKETITAETKIFNSDLCFN